MKVNNVHERVFAATADELAALIADFDRIGRRLGHWVGGSTRRA
jgi:hypothetical protein